jgi:hypothetical protein
MDLKRPKIQSSWIQKKLAPSHSAHPANYRSIFVLKNGLCMEKISRFEVFSKQGKIQRLKSIVRTTDVSSTDHTW